MDITRHNFRELYPRIEEAINGASFIAIDGEFSGVTNSTYKLTNYDSPEERYHKLKDNVSNFLLMQFGLAVFKWDPKEEKHIAEAFNFYIFPFRSSSSGIPDRIFSCQSSSIDFLAAQRFDFNKVFYSGIPYLTPEEEANVRASLNEKHLLRLQTNKSPQKNVESNGAATDFASPTTSPTVVADARTQAFIEGVKNKVQEFLKTSEEMLELEPCNSYLRKVLYENLPKMFSEQLLLEARVDEGTGQRFIVIYRALSAESLKRRKEEAKAKDDCKLQDMIGFSKIIQLVSQSQKLVVGHNMLLDVTFTLQQFVCQLPATLDEFKSVICCIFPRLIDTKLMGSMLPFRDIVTSTALGEMHSRLCSPPFVLPNILPPEKYNPSKSDHDMDLNLHEAAYDAYITGASFLSMLSFLSSFRKESKIQVMANPASEIISPYVNKVFLMKSPDIPYLNLAGSDLTPSRSHVFHLQFPPSWRVSDIRMLFSPIGTAFNISWISDTQCFVGLHNKAQAKLVKKMLMRSTGADAHSYALRTYEEYQREVAGQIYSSQMYRVHPQPVYRNKVWRPSNGPALPGFSGAVTPSSSGSFTNSLAATRIVSSTENNDTPKGSHSSRKRSGEDSLAKTSSQASPSDTGPDKSGEAEMEEPDIKRPRSRPSSQTSVHSASSSVKVGVARTDIPSLLVSGEDGVTEEKIPQVPSAQQAQFEVPDTWG